MKPTTVLVLLSPLLLLMGHDRDQGGNILNTQLMQARVTSLNVLKKFEQNDAIDSLDLPNETSDYFKNIRTKMIDELKENCSLPFFLPPEQVYLFEGEKKVYKDAITRSQTCAPIVFANWNEVGQNYNPVDLVTLYLHEIIHHVDPLCNHEKIHELTYALSVYASKNDLLIDPKDNAKKLSNWGQWTPEQRQSYELLQQFRQQTDNKIKKDLLLRMGVDSNKMHTDLSNLIIDTAINEKDPDFQYMVLEKLIEESAEKSYEVTNNYGRLSPQTIEKLYNNRNFSKVENIKILVIQILALNQQMPRHYNGLLAKTLMNRDDFDVKERYVSAWALHFQENWPFEVINQYLQNPIIKNSKENEEMNININGDFVDGIFFQDGNQTLETFLTEKHILTRILLSLQNRWLPKSTLERLKQIPNDPPFEVLKWMAILNSKNHHYQQGQGTYHKFFSSLLKDIKKGKNHLVETYKRWVMAKYGTTKETYSQLFSSLNMYSKSNRELLNKEIEIFKLKLKQLKLSKDQYRDLVLASEMIIKEVKKLNQKKHKNL